MKYTLIKKKFSPHYLTILILILLVALFLRFWQLSNNPPSLFCDEISNGYNAYSILKTGRDEYGNFLPLTFRTFGDYNPALSVYALVPSIAIFGLNELAVRFPSALMGSLTVLLTYFLVLRLINSRKISLSASFLLAIAPWHLQFSRYDHEANFMVFFAILGLVLFLYSFKNYYLLLASSISFGLAANTYQGAKIWIPIFLCTVFFWYRKEILKFGSKLFLPLLILFISTIPILANLNNSLIRGQSVGIFNKNNNILNAFISGYLSHFSPNFLFISGDNIGRHAVPGMGELYVFELPLILFGIFALIRQKTTSSKFLLTWFLLAPIPAALATPTPHALRAVTFLPLWSIVAAFGINAIANLKIKKAIKLTVALVLLLLAIYNVITYFHLYYKHYPKEKGPDWGYGYKEMINFVNKVKDNYSSIAITDYYGRAYIYVLFYTKYEPAKYQPQSENKNAFDKFEFFKESWQKTKSGKALVVTPSWQAHPTKVLKEIYGSSTAQDLIFRISEGE